MTGPTNDNITHGQGDNMAGQHKEQGMHMKNRTHDCEKLQNKRRETIKESQPDVTP